MVIEQSAAATGFEIPIRFSKQNDRVCDHARQDFHAGLHKYVLSGEIVAQTGDANTWVCCLCGRVWCKRFTTEMR